MPGRTASEGPPDEGLQEERVGGVGSLWMAVLHPLCWQLIVAKFGLLRREAELRRMRHSLFLVC